MTDYQTKDKHISSNPDSKILISLGCSWSNEITQRALNIIGYAQTIPVTHLSRLSGFNREAQPWRVFFACRVGSGKHAC